MTSRGAVPAIEIKRFGESLDGSLVLPGDEGWESARSVWNGLIDRHPIAVLLAISTDDVVAAVRFAAAHELPLAVRGGGYNVAGHGTVDDGLVLDLWPMNDVEVDAGRQLVTVEGGATQKQLDEATFEYGLAVPSGSLPSVGIGGLTLGGGMGLLTRPHGLTIDHLASAELVTADGRLVSASAIENPELFWGIRGGGGNFGVATRFQFKAVSLPREVIAGSQFYIKDDWARALRLYAHWARGLPAEMSTMAEWSIIHEDDEDLAISSGDLLLAISICWTGADREEGYDLVDELWDGGVQPVHSDVAVVDWLELQAQGGDDLPWGTRAYVKSIYLDVIDEATIAVLVEEAGRHPPLGGFDIHQLGGAYARVPGDATAFGSREEKYLVNIWAYWELPEDDAEEIAWVRSVWDAIEPNAVAGHNVNYLGLEDPDELQAQALDSYPPDAWERLVAVKNAWDPTNLFRGNHNVPPVSTRIR